MVVDIGVNCAQGIAISFEVPAGFQPQMVLVGSTDAFIYIDPQYRQYPSFAIQGSCLPGPILNSGMILYETEGISILEPMEFFSTPYESGIHYIIALPESIQWGATVLDRSWETYFGYDENIGTGILPFVVSQTLRVSFYTDAYVDQDLIWHIVNSIDLH